MLNSGSVPDFLRYVRPGSAKSAGLSRCHHSSLEMVCAPGVDLREREKIRFEAIVDKGEDEGILVRSPLERVALFIWGEPARSYPISGACGASCGAPGTEGRALYAGWDDRAPPREPDGRPVQDIDAAGAIGFRRTVGIDCSTPCIRREQCPDPSRSNIFISSFGTHQRARSSCHGTADRRTMSAPALTILPMPYGERHRRANTNTSGSPIPARPIKPWTSNTRGTTDIAPETILRSPGEWPPSTGGAP
jgi:hypothetical protein